MTSYTIGADISKDHIDLHRLPDGATLKVSNDKAGFMAIVKWIGTKPVERLVYEPTGAYHKLFETALAEKGVPLCKVNPRRARQFAEASGKLAKTDRADALLLARFGLMTEPEIRPVNDTKVNELKALHMARIALVKDGTAAQNRSKNLTNDVLKRQNAERIKQIEIQIEELDREITALIKGDT